MDKYKLVPLETTDEMVIIGAEDVHDTLRLFNIEILDDLHNATEIEQHVAESCFNAMLAAAPAVQVECLGVGKCTDQGCPAHYAAAPAVQVEPVAWMHSDPGRVDVIHDKVRKLLKDSSDNAGYLHRPLDKSERYTIPLYTASQPAEQHPDDAAVDRFAAAMKAKLAKKRQEGRWGWQSMTAGQLSALLHEHVHKGDPVDVANLAMMLHQNGQGIKQKPVPDVTLLVETLESIAEYWNQDGNEYAMLNACEYTRSAALAALAAYRKQGDGQ